MAVQPWEKPPPPLALPLWATPKTLAKGGFFIPSRADVTSGWPDGTLASDSSSIALWGWLMFGGRIVSQRSLDAMTTFGPGNYGLGVINQAANGLDVGTTAIGNGGWWTDYSTVLSCLPDRGVVISVLTTSGADPRVVVFPVVEALADALQS